MGRLAELIDIRKPPLWIDACAYAGRLLAAGAPPWLRATEFVAWHRQAQGLLKSGVVALPAGPMVSAWLAKDTELAAAMGSKRRVTFPLRTLLAHEPLRSHVIGILHGLRESYPDLPLALIVPSPRCWVIEAWRTVHGEAPEVGEEEVDAAGVYLADFLRTFGTVGVDVLLLDETPDSEPESLAELRWYQPVINVAQHYRWDLGLRLPVMAHEFAQESGLGFVIAPRPVNGVATGVAVPAAFWRGGTRPHCPAGGFLHAEIPVDANPETVLSGLEVLRSSLAGATA